VSESDALPLSYSQVRRFDFLILYDIYVILMLFKTQPA